MKKLSIDAKIKLLRDEVLYFEEIDSTNAYLLNTNNINNGTVALADFQTAGRGRLSRKWEAPTSDALLFSFVLNKDLNLYSPAAFTFIASVGVLEGLASIYYGLRLSLKWPNDIIYNGKKICGILVESKSAGNTLSKVVVGIGININQDEEFFAWHNFGHATSLKMITGNSCDRKYLLETVLESLEQNLLFAQNNEIGQVLEKWKSHCPYIGKHIKLLDNQKEYLGIFEDMNHDGGIILNIHGNRQTFYAGDVSIDKDYL